ncbi:MAG: NADH-quinone oxidoreductase subunit N [Desulfobacterales bacterium]|nr:NADH-quinone oxidoreductase subunit N [Desulfobacterales bacterium]MBF0397937.1 NADH-quinone oxidoreductase subunit N [Desulfobacterales bacterium]
MQISLFLPELILCLMVLFFFFVSLGKPKTKFLENSAILLSSLAVIVSVITFKNEGMLFFDAYRIDAFSQVFKIIMTVGLLLVVYLGNNLKGIELELQAEYYFFLSLSVLGLICMSSSVELLTILISLEVSSFALYVIIPFRKKQTSRSQMEAGIKYILFGAASTGITLYGMSYVFGLTHTTYITELYKVIPALLKTNTLIFIGMIMMLCGFFYKLALFPMHFWAPDVYEGAANETTSFIATLPKIGAVALLIRLVSLSGIDINQLTWIMAAIAVISMTVGNLSALVQNDIKRLLAYSSIAHAGYVMLGIFSGNDIGYIASIYYILGYLLMNLACFFVVYHVSNEGENVTFSSFAGLYKRSPFLSLTLAIGAFGLAGIPPTIGFTGKILLFTAAIKKGFYGIVVLAVINAGISAFYYLKMVRAAYFGVDDASSPIKLHFSAKILGTIVIATIILFGVLPERIIEVAKLAISKIIL